MRDNSGRSALMKAAETGQIEILHYLLSRGAISTTEDLRRRTTLHVACENGHFDIATVLLDLGVNINAQDCYTGAELCFLIRGKDKGMVKHKVIISNMPFQQKTGSILFQLMIDD